MSSSNDEAMVPPRVFVSYSHDSAQHRDLVRRFAELLRSGLGFDVHLDQWADDSRRDWAQWAIEQIGKAHYVLAIASPAFRERTDGRAPAHLGRGAQFEGALLRDRMTRDRTQWVSRILPVVLPGCVIDDIPDFLLPYSATHYIVDELTLDGIADVVHALAGQARHPMPPRGEYRGAQASDPTSPVSDAASRTRAPQPATVDNSKVVRIKHSNVENFVMGDVYHFGDE
jgi:hypothetical protein